MAALGNLLVSIRASAKEWSEDLKSIERDAKALEGTLKPIKKNLEDFGKPLLAVGVGITAAFAGMIKVAADYGDSIDQMAEKTGIETQQLSKLKYAADQSNTSFEGVSIGLKFLAKNLFAAGQSGSEQAKIFKSLGVSVKTASGDLRPMNDVLLDVANVFKKIPDGAAKGALSMKLFGKSGEDMIPLLNRGSDGITRLGKDAETLGLVLDPVSAALGDKFNKALDKAKNAGLGFSVAIADILIPSLLTMADKATSTIVWLRGWASEFPNVTKAVAALGLALTGAGGLLLALSGILIIAPKVAAALLLMESALAPATILLGVRSFEELGIAMNLLLAQSTAAKLGAVGLAAAVGVGIGVAINAGIAYLGLTDSLDKLYGQYIKVISFGQIDWTGNQRNAINDNKALLDVSEKLAASLAKQGIVVARGSDDLKTWNDRLIAAVKGTADYKNALAATAASSKAAGAATSDYDKILKSLLDTTDKTKTHFKELADMEDEQARHLRALGKISAADLEQRETDTENRRYAAEVKANGKSVNLKEEHERILSKIHDDAETARAAADLAEQQQTQTDIRQIEALQLATLNARLTGDLAFHRRMFDIGIESADALNTIEVNAENARYAAQVDANGASELLAQEHANALEAIEGEHAANVLKIDDTVEKARMLFLAEQDRTQNAAYDKGSADAKTASVEIIKTLKQQARLGIEISKEWSRAMNQMGKSIASSVADMVVHWKFSAKGLVDIAKDTAKSMLSAFLEGMIKPLTDKLASLGASFTKWALGISGGGGGGGGGILGSVLGTGGLLKAGKALGGLLGIGSAAAGLAGAGAGVAAAGAGAAGISAGAAGLAASLGTAGAGTAAATSAAVGTTGAAGGFGATLGALATNPVTIAAAAALAGALLVKKFVGEGRKTANKFTDPTSGVQGIFDTNLKGLLDSFNAAKAAGTLTLADARKSEAALHELWDAEQQASEAFAAGGKNERKVVDQANAFYAKNFGAGLSTSFAQMDAEIARLSGPRAAGLAGAEGGVPTANLSGMIQITINSDADPAAIASTIAKAMRSDVAPALTRLLGLNADGLTSDWIRIFHRNELGVPA